MTTALRLCPSANETIASYVFRDHLDELLRKKVEEGSMTKEDFERYMEHTEETSRAAYARTEVAAIRNSVAAEEKKKKTTSPAKSAKKSPASPAKKTSSSIKKNSPAKKIASSGNKAKK